MAQELPGFYYDPEKNRYFPIKGPIPGSKSYSKSNTDDEANDQQHQFTRSRKEKNCKTATELLQLRELFGKVVNYKRENCNFQHEFKKIQASQPMVWKYQGMERTADTALEQFDIDMQTLEGQIKTRFLFMGSMSGLRLYEVAEVGKHIDYNIECIPDPIWPFITENQAECIKVPGHLWSPIDPRLMPSNISSIKGPGKHSPRTADDGSAIPHALISTLGAETSGGSVYIMKLGEPLDYNLWRRIIKVASLRYTIWTADCHPDGSHAVIGTNQGAALLNLETGAISWLCRSKSDIFSQQFDQSGNVILCGFRNGAIVTVDVRQRQQGSPSVLPRHRIPYSSNIGREHSSRRAQKLTKQWFELKGNIYPSSTIYMPSSISSLLSLQTDDQYFLASSMDGSIKLYDHRLIQRGPIQSYEGHVNSHTRIQLGVDSSEELVMSGGEDGKVCIWSIKTGELLFGTKISNSVPTTVCWPGTEKPIGMPRERHKYEENLYEKNHSWGAWLGSAEELFYIHGS